MRIENKIFLLQSPLKRCLAAALVAFGLCSVPPAYAQNVLPDASAPAAPQADAPIMPSPLAIVSADEGLKTDHQSIRKSVSSMEEKAIANAKTAIKRLDNGSDVTTLEDLNLARQTVTRIEAMIELEKRLKELEKLRGARASASLESIESAIPQTAFAPQVSAAAVTPPPALPEPVVSVAPVKASSSRYGVTQIYGTGGKYMAVLKSPDGEKRIVKVGDKINDSEVVQSITTSSVEIAGKKKSYTLHISNGGVIYNAMR